MTIRYTCRVALMLWLCSFLTGCMIPKGTRVLAVKEVAFRLDQSSNVLDCITEKTIAHKAILLFSPEGGNWDYTSSLTHRYFLRGAGLDPIELSFLKTKQYTWLSVWPVSGTNLWVAVRNASPKSPPHGMVEIPNVQAVVFDSNRILREKWLMVSWPLGHPPDLRFDEQHNQLVYAVASGHENYSVLEDGGTSAEAQK